MDKYVRFPAARINLPRVEIWYSIVENDRSV